MLAVLTVIDLFVFIIVARWYKYRVPEFETEQNIIEPNEDTENGVTNDGYGLDHSQSETNGKEQWQPVWSETAKL